MKQMARREFCSRIGAFGIASYGISAFGIAVFGEGTFSPGQSATAALPVTLTIDGAKKLETVPRDFMGLSYESGQLAYPDFFSAQNKDLVAIFRTLSPSGVLRLGGNLSEFTIWSETDPAVAPEAGGLVGPDPGKREPRTYTISPASIRNLRAFLDATGWRCIYGLNLGGGTLEQALAEGSYVARTLGPRLMCVQFGNEADLFKHHDQGNKPWTYEEFIGRWKTFRAAFHEHLPSVTVAGPDTAVNAEWVKRFTEDVPKQVLLVTSHYYPEGPPTDPRMNIELLLHPGARFDSSCRKPLEYAKKAGLPFRMTEGNSCYNAGKPGVSDTFASALWAGDFCLQLAAMGCVGVNLHGGANGAYSPIVGSTVSGFKVRPEYYGLLLAQEFAGSNLYATTIDAQGANLTAYAAGDSGIMRKLVVFNKDPRAAEVTIDVGSGKDLKHAMVQRLEAPAIGSVSGVKLDGSTVGNDGSFHPRTGDPLVKSGEGGLRVQVPAYSAALIRMA